MKNLSAFLMHVKICFAFVLTGFIINLLKLNVLVALTSTWMKWGNGS